MIITGKELKNVAVYTQSGQHLGSIHDFDIDTNTGNVTAYHIKTTHGLKGLFEDSLIIDKNDVIDFDRDTMIVRDRAGKVLESADTLPGTIETQSTPIISES